MSIRLLRLHFRLASTLAAFVPALSLTQAQSPPENLASAPGISSSLPSSVAPSALPTAPSSQAVNSALTPKAISKNPNPGTNCPSGFPTDLGVANCSYTPKMRRQDWISSSLTDEAIYGSVFYALLTQYVYPIPEEWPRTWTGYGQRFGASYLNSVTEGTVAYAVSAAFHEDPRHVTYYSDPKVLNRFQSKLAKSKANGEDKEADLTTAEIKFESHTHFWARLGHATLDSISDRVSTPTGNGHWMPAASRAAGIIASTYSGYLWYPASQNTGGQHIDHAVLAYGFNFGGSIIAEFGDDLASAGSTSTHWVVHIFFPKKDDRPEWNGQ